MILGRVEIVGEEPGAREIVVSGDTVVRMGEPEHDVSGDGPRIDFDEAIAFPGLTNSHDHLEFNLYPPLGHERYRDYVHWGRDIERRDAARIAMLESVPRPHRLRWGALKNLLCGVTTVAQHSDRSDDRMAGPIDTVVGTSIHSVRFARRWRCRLNGLRDRSPYVFHVGEGTSPASRAEVDELLRWNVLRRRLVGVHAIAMTFHQAVHFDAVVWCPLSNEFLFGATADVAALKGATRILLGSDSTLTADWNFWNHLRRARAHRALDDRQLFEAVTSAASSVWRRPGTGRIGPGQTADLVIARKKADGPWDGFFAVDPEEILLVMRRGAVVLADESIKGLPERGLRSAVRMGTRVKRVAEDVPALLAAIRAAGVEPNLPIRAVATD